MKKYMIRCDIEGVTGVVSYEQSNPGMAEHDFGKRMFMADLLALVEGLNAGGADEIWIYDEHYFGRNIDIAALPENVKAICGKPPYTADWAGGLDESFDGLILQGFHSKNGTGELLHHSYEPDIKDLVLNGMSIGEIGIETAVAGDWGVPLLMIIADSAGVKEAETLASGVIGVSVKKSLGASGGACLSGKLTLRMIHEAAKKVVSNPPSVKAWKVNAPELKIVFNPGPCLNKFRELFNCGDDIVITGKTVTECWAKYWQMKLKTQDAMK